MEDILTQLCIHKKITIEKYFDEKGNTEIIREFTGEISKLVDQYYNKIVIETGEFQWEIDLNNSGDSRFFVFTNETENSVEYLVSNQKTHFVEHSIVYDKTTKKLTYKGYTELLLREGSLISHPSDVEMDYADILELILKNA
jgi:hypothetical protein